MRKRAAACLTFWFVVNTRLAHARNARRVKLIVTRFMLCLTHARFVLTFSAHLRNDRVASRARIFLSAAAAASRSDAAFAAKRHVDVHSENARRIDRCAMAAAKRRPTTRRRWCSRIASVHDSHADRVAATFHRSKTFASDARHRPAVSTRSIHPKNARLNARSERRASAAASLRRAATRSAAYSSQRLNAARSTRRVAARRNRSLRSTATRQRRAASVASIHASNAHAWTSRRMR